MGYNINFFRIGLTYKVFLKFKKGIQNRPKMLQQPNAYQYQLLRGLIELNNDANEMCNMT